MSGIYLAFQGLLSAGDAVFAYVVWRYIDTLSVHFDHEPQSGAYQPAGTGDRAA